MNRIKEVAEQRNMKITDVVKATRLSRSFLYDIISEKSFPTTPVAQKIAKCLNSSLNELFPDD